MLVLADFDNLRAVRFSTHKDVEDVIDAFVEHLATWIRTASPATTYVDVRLYGGWRTTGGGGTTHASWAEIACSNVRGVRGGIRFRPTLAVSLLQLPGVVFNGTHRRRSGRRTQKMVDTMLAIDAVHSATALQIPVVVASNDEDLTPAIAVAASTRQAAIHWHRPGRTADGCNDQTLRGLGVNALNTRRA